MSALVVGLKLKGYNEIVAGTRLGIVGCGAIGGDVARCAVLGDLPLALYALCDIAAEKASELRETAGPSAASHGFFPDSPPFVLDLDTLAEECDFVLESASAEAVREVISAVSAACAKQKSAKTVVVMSVGGLALLPSDELNFATRTGLRIAVPSGAVGGIDAILAMRESGIFQATLTTTKNPKSLGRVDRKIEVVFEGPALEAVQKFPKNINVAMTLSLALGNNVPLTVRIVSDPGVSTNTHVLEVEGGTGSITVKLENEPHPDVPRTSLLAAKSAVATLRKLASGFTLGT